jgi:hypothetical protein
LTEEELEEALKDLDLNKDGVIDFSEFQRWWFSGFKSYSGTKRSMIKVRKTAKNAFEALVQGNLDSPLSGDLKIKQHSLEVGFNVPSTAATKISCCLYPGGDTCYKIHSDLKAQYKDTLDANLLNELA